MAKSFDDKKEETSSARYLQFMKWKCISLIFHSCNKEENRDALIIKYSFFFSSGGRGCDIFGEKHCFLRVGYKRVVEVRKKDLSLNCLPIYANYAIWIWIVIYLREFIMDCPEGVLTKEKVSIIIRQTICSDTQKTSSLMRNKSQKIIEQLWSPGSRHVIVHSSPRQWSHHSRPDIYSLWQVRHFRQNSIRISSISELCTSSCNNKTLRWWCRDQNDIHWCRDQNNLTLRCRDQNGRIDFNEFIIATHCTGQYLFYQFFQMNGFVGVILICITINQIWCSIKLSASITINNG